MTLKIFVTGAAGFIGRELTKKLLLCGYQVVCFDVGEQFALHKPFFDGLENAENLKIIRGTILDRNKLLTSMSGCNTTFHLAAMLGVRRTEENRLRCMEVNVTGTDMVLSACASNDVKHIIFASSSEVYGEPNKNPIKETDETKGKTVYAVSKLAGEELVVGYHQLFDKLNYSIIRFFNTYGEGQVAQFVLMRFAKAVLTGNNPQVFGDGAQQRSYGHVDDVTDGLLSVIMNPAAYQNTYNLGNSSQLYSLKELAQKVIDLLAPDKGLRVDVLNSFDGSDRTEGREIFVRYCDTSKAERELGYNPRITIDEGIRRISALGTFQDDWPESW